MLFVCPLFVLFVIAAFAESNLIDKPTSAARTFTGVNEVREKRETSYCPKAPLKNLALRRPATQSTTHGTNRTSKAVDGVRQANWVPPYCTHTEKEYNPYWYVDLGGEHVIERVEIVKLVGIGHRLRDFSVVVARHDGKYDQTCGHYKGPATGLGVPVVTVRCPANTCGRYVKIQMATNPPEYLNLCEVEVHGY